MCLCVHVRLVYLGLYACLSDCVICLRVCVLVCFIDATVVTTPILSQYLISCYDTIQCASYYDIVILEHSLCSEVFAASDFGKIQSQLQPKREQFGSLQTPQWDYRRKEIVCQLHQAVAKLSYYLWPEQWMRCIGVDCMSTHFPGVNASLGKTCTCARSSVMSK